MRNRIFNHGSIDHWDKAPTKEYFIELFRVSKNQIIWGGNYFNLPPTRCVVCWDKVQPWLNFSQIEMAWTSFNLPAKLFRFDNRTADKIHPTQKPIELYLWLLKTFMIRGGVKFLTRILEVVRRALQHIILVSISLAVKSTKVISMPQKKDSAANASEKPGLMTEEL